MPYQLCPVEDSTGKLTVRGVPSSGWAGYHTLLQESFVSWARSSRPNVFAEMEYHEYQLEKTTEEIELLGHQPRSMDVLFRLRPTSRWLIVELTLDRLLDRDKMEKADSWRGGGLLPRRVLHEERARGI